MIDLMNILQYLVQELGYNTVVHIKDVITLMSGVFVGIVLTVLYTSKLFQKSFKDKNLDEVSLVKIKEGNKTHYYTNPSNTKDTIRNLITVFFWQLGLFKNKYINFTNSKRARVFYYTTIFFVTVTIFVGFLLSSVVIDLYGILDETWYTKLFNSMSEQVEDVTK